MKKITKLFTVLTILAMSSAFLSCSSPSGNGSENGTGTSTGAATNSSTELNGTYVGYITAADGTSTLYLTVNVNDPSYEVKEYLDEAKTNLYWTVTGTITSKQSTAYGWGFSGTAAGDHTMAATPAGNNQWNVTVTLLVNPFTGYTGVVTKQ